MATAATTSHIAAAQAKPLIKLAVTASGGKEMTLGPIFMATWPISLMFHAGRTLAAVTL